MSTTTDRPTPSLTDRYVFAAGRSVAESQRADLQRELRERIGDAVDALVEEGRDPVDAERTALAELGDPAALAASYTDRPLQLIGPRFFLTWWRLLKLLWWIVLPLVGTVILTVQIVSGAPIGTIIGTTWSVTLTVAVHIGFWTTLVFAIIDRYSPETPVPAWAPEMLPEPTDPKRSSRAVELVVSLIFLTLFAFWLVWQQFSPWPSDASGDPVVVLNPELWSFWLPYFLALIALEMAFAVAIYLRGWNWWLAGANLLLNIAFTVPALWLFLTGRVFSEEFLDLVRWPWGDAGPIVATIIVVVVIGTAAWDVIDGVLKTRRARLEERIASA